MRWSTGHLPLAWSPVPSTLAVLAVALGATDLVQRRLPNVLTYASYPVLATALAPWALTGRAGDTVTGALLGGIAFGGAHLVVHLIRPRSLGAGDVKLAGALGAVLGVLGPPAVLLAALMAAAGTLALSAGQALLGGRRWRAGVPYGPGLLVATWLLSVTPEAGLVT
nr:A24 family peptidase [Haloechinothrix aidingensis]